MLLASASYFRKHGLNEKLCSASAAQNRRKKALSGKQLTRDELALALVNGGVSTNNDSIALVMLRLRARLRGRERRTPRQTVPPTRCSTSASRAPSSSSPNTR
ncbi:MAG: hypothetical protein QM756_25435 [Polyangiaceae bacterium]